MKSWKKEVRQYISWKQHPTVLVELFLLTGLEFAGALWLSKQSDEVQFEEKVEKKYCYALEDFERLFYKGFNSKNNDCGTLCHYHNNRGYAA